MRPIRELFEYIERITPDGGNWCTAEKALSLASMVISIRPRLVVEIGVWRGGSFLPLAVALQALGGEERRKIIGIDPWETKASVVGQAPPDAAWWGSVDHEESFQVTIRRLAANHLPTAVFNHQVVVCSEPVELWRMAADDAPVTALAPAGAGEASIDILHIDGNHAEQARRDVGKFAPFVRGGGFCILDDIGWTGGHVAAAGEWLLSRGFVELYDLAPGRVYQRCT